MEMREIIKIIEENGLQLHGDIEHFVYLIEEKISADEREACARLCHEVCPTLDGQLIAEAIRARGET